MPYIFYLIFLTVLQKKEELGESLWNMKQIQFQPYCLIFGWVDFNL